MGCTTVAVVMAATWWQRRSPQTKHLMDRRDPRKSWAQAAMALYQGDAGDPGYWSKSDATSLIQQGWSTANRDELVDLIHRYIDGECNVGFDKIRIIWLARLGYGAGWFDEATSWGYVFGAAEDLRRTYGSWPEVKQAVSEGRVQWYGGPDQVPPQQLNKAEQSYAYANKTFFASVPFR